jgi:hypothetical protein
MRCWNPIIVALLLAGCTRPSSQPAAARPRGAAAEPATRTLDSFAFDWATTRVRDVIAKAGEPDGDVGSGLYILSYRLRDGSYVWIGSPDNSTIIYVRHGRGTIGEAEILYPRQGEILNEHR